MPRKKKKPIQKPEKTQIKQKCNYNSSGCGGCFYGLGFIGSLVYYLSTATSFWNGLLGVLKAIVWPGFLVYELLKFLGV